MPVHGYTCNNLAQYFFNIHKALGIVFLKHPLILSLGIIYLGQLDFRKKKYLYLATWQKI